MSREADYKADLKNKIMSWEQAGRLMEKLHDKGKKVVFTNGCFDLLHVGHLHYLADARNLGDFLVIGLNSDRSVREIKGAARPITPQDQRAQVLSGLEVVNAVVVFDQPDPLELIACLQPDILVKGGDWPIDKIIGRDVVQARGGRVLNIPLTPGISTTAIIERIIKLNTAV